MPTIAAINPANWGGHRLASVLVTSRVIHVPSPPSMANNAPTEFARFQYRPKTSGTNAATKVTL